MDRGTIRYILLCMVIFLLTNTYLVLTYTGIAFPVSLGEEPGMRFGEIWKGITC